MEHLLVGVVALVLGRGVRDDLPGRVALAPRAARATPGPSLATRAAVVTRDARHEHGERPAHAGIPPGGIAGIGIAPGGPAPSAPGCASSADGAGICASP